LFGPTDAVMLKCLRFAVTALSLTMCVGLIGLWVRSYLYFVNIQTLPFANRTLQCTVSPGRMYFRTNRRDFDWLSGVWQIHKSDADFNNWDHPDQSAFFVSINQWGPGDIAFRFPFWFPVVITAALAAAPWLRCRFSLRTMLIATTMLAALLGAIVCAIR
jgi:hypothetical protein